MTDSTDLKLPSLQRLQSAEQMELLNVVDSLRACGLSEIVALPQLIVCGDQSSGKSSVLEAISGIPFPRQDNLCTRFATEVILRRAPKDDMSVSIVPGKDRTPADIDRLKQFRHELKNKNDFSGLFEIARDAMGLSSAGKSFSNDVLRVEFCGPSQPQLTFVDLPGLIHSETKSQTPSDVKLVHNLVSQYLQNPRSIILAVVSAKNDIGSQIRLHRARQVDPQGLRTLGIITKPDLLVKGSKSEDAFIALARNEEVKFSLGWHVVKNLDSATNKEEPGARDEQETLFFQDSSFSRLPSHTVGISFLRERLSKVLFKQIQTELPRLVKDIQSQISAAKIVRDKLGPSRVKLEEQRSFLISLSQSFQAICRDAVRGDYDHEFFRVDSSPERRLCANVMNMHFDFAENMRKNGAYWLIEDENINDHRYRSREEAIEEACILLKRSRGRELPGLPNPLLVGELFREYSQPWADLARAHIKRVWEATIKFFELLLGELTDDDACENVFRFWLYPVMEEKLNSAYGKLDELLEVHKDYPMTTNHQFLNNSRRSREDNSNKVLDDPVLKTILQSGQNVGIDEISRLLSAMNTKPDLDMDMVAAEEAFDNMNAYYEVAMNLFTDNVPTITIQGPIIREAPKIFCPTAVFSMEADVIKCIAGEADEKMRERDEVLQRLQTLESGARICKLYSKRPQPFLNTARERNNTTELPENDRQSTEISFGKAHPKAPSTPKHFSESVAGEGIIKNPFNHISSPSQTKTPRSKSSQPPSHTKNAKDSPKPAGGLVSSTSSVSPGTNIFGSATPKTSGVETANANPTSGGIVGSTYDATLGTSGVGGTNTNLFGGGNFFGGGTPKPSRDPSTLVFGATSSNVASGSKSSTSFSSGSLSTSTFAHLK